MSARLDVERLARRFLERHPGWSTEDDAVVDVSTVTIGVASLRDFARSVARACARVADGQAEQERGASVASGCRSAGDAIRRAIAPRRTKG